MTAGAPLLECVINVSEGRDRRVLAILREAAGPSAIDLHADPDHHRAVFTLAGPEDLVVASARRLAVAAVEHLDLRDHAGAHPRLGVLDVVPWIRLEGHSGRLRDGDPAPAVAERDAFARRAAAGLGLPCFLYGGGGPTLPEVRRRAWRDLQPDVGPDQPHPTAGAACVGARPLLVAYNLWLAEPDLSLARRIAAEVRAPGRRALGLAVGDRVQVSCNLVEPLRSGPADAFDAVAARTAVAGAELVGLLPRAVLDRTPQHRWAELDLDPSTTIEARLEEAGLDGGSPFTAAR